MTTSPPPITEGVLPENCDPDYLKYYKYGARLQAMLNDKEKLRKSWLPFVDLRNMILAAVGGVALIVASTMLSGYLGYLAPAQVFDKEDAADSTDQSSEISASSLLTQFNSPIRATEQPLELTGDIPQAMNAIAKGDASPFTPWPANGAFSAEKFSIKKSSDGNSGVIALPIAHYYVGFDRSDPTVAPKAKFSNPDGSLTDAPTPTSMKKEADTLFVAAFRKEGDRFVAYNLVTNGFLRHQDSSIKTVSEQQLSIFMKLLFGKKTKGASQ